MFFIPGFIISIFTFPGIIVHEFAHRFFADLMGVPVYEVCYFKLGSTAGYIVHGEPLNLKQSFLISVGPLLVNTILCSIIGSCVAYPLIILELTDISPIIMFLAWLSVSIGMHALPSNQDMLSFDIHVNKVSNKGVLYYFSKIMLMFFRLMNALRVFWIDLIYAICVIALIPTALMMI